MEERSRVGGFGDVKVIQLLLHFFIAEEKGGGGEGRGVGGVDGGEVRGRWFIWRGGELRSKKDLLKLRGQI